MSEWSAEQLYRLDEFGVLRCADVHCHVLPGLDDGPATEQEAVALCRALVRDGITTVVATPHQLGRYDRLNSAEVVRQQVSRLLRVLEALKLPLEIVPGGDVRIDERLPKLLDQGEITTVADAGRHVLLEMPHELYVDPLPTIVMLQQRQMQAVITHPERHRYLNNSVELPRAWKDKGALLQITAGSLTGDFGNRAFQHAWKLVKAGLVSIVATDAHDVVRRPPRLTSAIRRLKSEIGIDQTRALCLENPLRIIEGDYIGEFDS